MCILIRQCLHWRSFQKNVSEYALTHGMIVWSGKEMSPVATALLNTSIYTHAHAHTHTSTKWGKKHNFLLLTRIMWGLFLHHAHKESTSSQNSVSLDDLHRRVSESHFPRMDAICTSVLPVLLPSRMGLVS